VTCPHCLGRDVGRIAPDHYFCWDCCVEFARDGEGWQVFALDDEGQLLPLPVAGGEADEGLLEGCGNG